ncbi:MAG: sugar ABC transporter permease [Chloroflexota bacterium]
MTNFKFTYRNSESLLGWAMASPWIIGFIIFTAGPMIASLWLAGTDWDLLSSPKWVGLANFQTMIWEDELPLHALRITALYALMSLPLHLLFGVSLAMLLNTNIRGLAVLRTIYYLPAILAGVAVALLWRWIFSAEFGLLNLALSWVGIQGPAWLADRTWVLPSFVVMSLWGVGGSMVIYLAGLQAIPTDLYEAAEIDGANWIHRILNITLPMLSPVIFFQLVMGIIQAMQIFTQAFIMTNGGPANASLFYMLYLYRQAFQFFNMGYASALAWVLFLCILLLTLLVFRTASTWVYYEAETGGRS